MTDFAKNMHEHANDIGDKMEAVSQVGWKKKVRRHGGKVISNVKPFYSPYHMFDPSTKRVFIGVNPAGKPWDPDDTTGTKYAKLLGSDDYNAYVDEVWEGESVNGRAELQVNVQKVFETLFPHSEADRSLRDTACFNVCPLRTKKPKFIPDEIWEDCVDWTREILETIKPEIIICNGNGLKTSDPPKSPWASLQQMHLDIRPYVLEQPRTVAPITCGTIMSGPLKDAKVVGFPHMSWNNVQTRRGTISALKDRFIDRRINQTKATPIH